jgi:two-component system, OmpR family, sensor histidine kinase PhoQ
VVRVSYQAIRPSVVIEVQDDGPGIPAEKLPVLFQNGPGHERAALGLLIVRDFVIAHAGHLDVRSSSDAGAPGTVVRITLPI